MFRLLLFALCRDVITKNLRMLKADKKRNVTVFLELISLHELA